MTAREPATDAEATRFVEFNYPEIKDLVKHALTVMTGVVVFSVTFGDKIIANSPEWIRVCFGISICLFLVGLICAGRSMYLIFMAAEKAKGPVIYHTSSDFRDLG